MKNWWYKLHFSNFSGCRIFGRKLHLVRWRIFPSPDENFTSSPPCLLNENLSSWMLYASLTQNSFEILPASCLRIGNQKAIKKGQSSERLQNRYFPAEKCDQHLISGRIVQRASLFNLIRLIVLGLSDALLLAAGTSLAVCDFWMPRVLYYWITYNLKRR